MVNKAYEKAYKEVIEIISQLPYEEYKKILKHNQEKAEQEKRKKYNPNNIFKNNTKSDVSNKADEKVQLVELKESFF